MNHTDFPFAWDAYEFDTQKETARFLLTHDNEGELNTDEYIISGNAMQPLSKHLPRTEAEARAKYFAELQLWLRAEVTCFGSSQARAA